MSEKLSGCGSRRIHLDFHNSPAINNIGDKFNAEEFINTLKDANVDSITIFAKCVHGLCYYPTKIGKTHPGLKFDLLGEMIEACSKASISAPVYLTATWDDYAASIHQEWIQITHDGKLGGRHPLSTNTWREICLNTPFVDYFISLLEEIINNYKVDGFFVDMVKQDLEFNLGCICNYCLKSMEELNLEPLNNQELKKHSKIIEQKFIERVSNFVRSKIKSPILIINCRNSLLIDKSLSFRTERPFISHVEIESLPSQESESGGSFWGYDYFQKAVRFFTTLDVPTAVMTGIFHKGWGDFGSIKNKAALEYECFRAIANGATCCIGDQPHPSGVLDKEKYKRIGEVYKKVKEKEEWCRGAIPIKEIGVIFSEANENTLASGDISTDTGVLRILLEEKMQFQFLDRENNLDGYSLIILPDKISMDKDFLTKIKNYLKNGGRILISGTSGIDLTNNDVLLDEMGINFYGNFDYKTPYLKLSGAINQNIEDMEYIISEGGYKIKPSNDNIEILAKFWNPYFDRTYKHFSSHAQAPVFNESEFPAIVKNNNVIYIAFPIFKSYRKHAALVFKKIVRNCINLLLPDSIIRSNLPSTAEVTALEQGNRWIIHVLHYAPIRRGENIEVIEDVIPLVNKEIFVKCGFLPGKVYLAPERKDLNYSISGDYIAVKINEINGHEMIVIEK